ncbi:DUF3095 domain-containing protein [Lichenihabitans sp. Uapishka_5]|uniref:DUF3095 domain-containing protein n=1 Tax=Lichenihabitans sp. Uapishka_5 TaxID=3037302 RepID=UPI0029E812BD|nr:DUF3095 domain-containing protein [Lichenihabitans sp. Uapishka_5]MDX7950616.1 DUF3095 domain-containing protein [Lichenihabitans sp. Uapishka_5]
MDTFYTSLPTLREFERITDRQSYRSLPDDWVVGLADVVSSTAAVAEGRYKAVNLAGAAVISSLANAKGSLDFPYVFTGDGMACAVPPNERALLEDTLSTAVEWVGSALGLSLRGAVISVEQIRAAGQDVRIARFTPNASMAYAMFSGGGVAWAETELKAGRLPPLRRRGGRPDLAGLSCRFEAMPSRKGVILSLIAAPARPSPDEAFRTLVEDVLRMTQQGNPVPPGGPHWGWPPAGLELEARLRSVPGRPLMIDRIVVGLRTLVAAVVVRFGLPLGNFRPARYRAEILDNTDFRKFGDGLMMTVDCTTDQASLIEARLTEAERDGVAHCGTHRQSAALMTCVVPSPSHPGHVHFIDGAEGGYTMAARQLKANRLAAAPLSATRPPDAVALAGAAP